MLSTTKKMMNASICLLVKRNKIGTILRNVILSSTTPQKRSINIFAIRVLNIDSQFLKLLAIDCIINFCIFTGSYQ